MIGITVLASGSVNWLATVSVVGHAVALVSAVLQTGISLLPTALPAALAILLKG
jgi:hypothetical protein